MRIIGKILLYIIAIAFGLSGLILFVNGVLYTSDPAAGRWLVIGAIQMTIGYVSYRWARKIGKSVIELELVEPEEKSSDSD